MEKTNKKFIIVLIKNDVVLPQFGLRFSNKNKANDICVYMNSLLPDNLYAEERYEVGLVEDYEWNTFLNTIVKNT